MFIFMVESIKLGVQNYVELVGGVCYIIYTSSGLKCFEESKCVLCFVNCLFSLPSFLQSRAHPREIMTEVLKALQELQVCWKKIGHYNMKCRWIPGIPGHHEGMVNNSGHNNHYFGDESTIIETDGVMKAPNVVKFEVQVTFLLYFR